jgi:hypothetical protein
MRALIAAAATGLALSIAGAAIAQQHANVTVTMGPELQSKAARIGPREITYLQEELAKDVSRALRKTGAQRADLVLEMATPNRPTFEQLGRRPGLSFLSFGNGGASVTGTVTLADGSVQPVSYRWYENDIRQAHYASTWTDAHRAFDMLAYNIGRGRLPNQGPHHAGDKDAGLFGTRYF